MSEYNAIGKLPPEVLKSGVLCYGGAHRPEVVVGPGLGEDAALIRWGDEPYLVVASDPVVGASHGAGRLLVHINANDVACKGGEPAWFMAALIVPARSGVEYVRRVMEEIHDVCSELGIAVVGGHTELTDRYDHPVLVGTMLGHSRYGLRADKIQEGDALLATKHAGLEGMAIIAHDRPDLLPFLSGAELNEVRSWQNDLSVLKEARLLRDLACYMHDPTEGGVKGGVFEICGSCGLDAEINDGDVPVSPLTARAAEKIGFDPLRLISSGVLLAALPEGNVNEAMTRLDTAGVEAKVIGHFTGRGGKKNKMSFHEELWSILDLPSPISR
ncbi:MAG: AIR synthase related protein [Synergistaceae bacterium]|nr:AIR synthase related protein [Synergistaceae bacterium]